MSVEEIRDFYLALRDPDKQIFLALVSSHLTIHGRYFGHYVSGEEQTRAFRGLNELQHQVSGHIVALGLGRGTFPDDIFWEILAEEAEKSGLGAHLKGSLEFARSRDLWKEQLK